MSETTDEERTAAYNMREITNNVIGDFLYDHASGNASATALTASLMWLCFAELVHIQNSLQEIKGHLARIQHHQNPDSSKQTDSPPVE